MNKRLNSKQQEELVKNNLKLVYYLANKFQTPLDDNYEDLISIGTIGLIKASQTFDESKEIKFVTYAACCIKNEFYMYYRKEKTHINAVSLDEPINVDNYGPEMTIGDKIMIDEEDFTKQIEQNEICARTLSILLNALPLRDKLLMLYKISGNTQQFISKKLNISQSYISRLEQKSITKIKLYMNNSRAFEEVYSVKIQDHLCQISFSIKMFSDSVI